MAITGYNKSSSLPECTRLKKYRNPDGNGCLGKNLPQEGPCLFRCPLQLPESTTVLELCEKKKVADLPWGRLLKAKLFYALSNLIFPAAYYIISCLVRSLSDNFYLHVSDEVLHACSFVEWSIQGGVAGKGSVTCLRSGSVMNPM
ncbi:hypothetical protein POM88_035200 [Heracleum sosnowskyi]|uniref:Uncharacterized protein n=1 Tax=Heracleum sosnowskyi TaxID=360622 RepID=A0AAD8MEG1_9APIA|nr:hypothetical protein POM88_035200 [Heracleum sosnowskyi]